MKPYLVTILIFILGLGLLRERALGQGADAFGAEESVGEEGRQKRSSSETREGLDQATPDEDLGELEQGNGTLNVGGDGENLPEMTDQASSPDNPSGLLLNNQSSGNNLFGNAATAAENKALSGSNSPNVSQGSISAFGNGGEATNGNLKTNAAGANAPAQSVKATVTPESNAPIVTDPSPPPPIAGGSEMVPSNGAQASSLPTGLSSGGPDSEEVQIFPSPPAVDLGSAGLLPKAETIPPPNDFAGAPPVPGTMRLMAEGEAPEEYRVQPGDTLFDICDQLIDEPQYWPKLWALNPEIKNPHFIFPSMRLGFYPGDDDTPPYLEVIHEDDVIPIDKAALDENALVREKVAIVAGDGETVVQEAAAETVVEVIGPDQVDLGDLADQFLVGGSLFSPSDIRVQLPGFIYATEKNPLGFVLGGRDGGVSVGPGGSVIIEKRGDLSEGRLYTVLREGGAIDNPVTGDDVGLLYYFVANVRIARRVKDDLMVGVAQDNRLGIKPDDIIVDYISTIRNLPLTVAGPYANVDATVVGFEDPGREISATHQFVFIDKGSGDGVSPGMNFKIYQKPGYLSLSSGEAGLPEDWQSVGKIRIVDATDGGAVGFIYDALQEFRLGDRTVVPSL